MECESLYSAQDIESPFSDGETNATKSDSWDSESEWEESEFVLSSDENSFSTPLSLQRVKIEKDLETNPLADYQAAFAEYLKLICCLSSSEVKTLIGRVASFMRFVLQEKGDRSTRSLHKFVFKKDVMVLTRYVQHMYDKKHKASTVYNHLIDLKRWADYISCHQSAKLASPSADFYKHIDQLQSKSGKRKRKEIRSLHSREIMQLENRWPAGGLSQLRALLIAYEPRAMRLISQAQRGEKDRATTRAKEFLEYMISHMYLANPQARIGGIHSLNFEGLAELRLKGSSGTDAFKTASVYGSQMIVMCPETLRLMEYWVRLFRPTILTPHSGDLLFLNTSGRPHTQLGSCLTNFFRPYGYHITTTALRSMQETESREAMRRNLISGCQADAITLHQGHSSTTARLYYQKDRIEDATALAVEAHNAMYGVLPTKLADLQSDDSDEYYPKDDDNDYPEVGPSILYLLQPVTLQQICDSNIPPARKRVRTSWSLDEELWLVNWVNAHVHSVLFSKRIDWKTCLEDIQKNTDAAHIFPVAHLNTTLLHEACKRIAKRRGIRVEDLS